MDAPLERKPRILFVCGRNKWRSPTAEALYRDDERVDVRSVGIRSSAHRRITLADLEWADLVLVMEANHRSWILSQFLDLERGPRLASLDIPDEYQFMDEELVERIREGTEYHLARIGGRS